MPDCEEVTGSRGSSRRWNLGFRSGGRLFLARVRRRWLLLRRPPVEKLIRKTAALGRRDSLLGTVAVEKLSQRALGSLIRRDAGRSIKTLHRALRELRRVDEKLLVALEEKLGARRYLDLILEGGTLVELLFLTRHSTPAMARRLIALLSAEDVERLHRQTAASDHSIGTLGAALRALEWADEDLCLALEKKLNERLFLELVLDSGTFFELFRFLGYPRAQVAWKLVAALEGGDIFRLHEQTVASRRSLGTLELRLRELALIDEKLTAAVIEKIGSRRWWRLILARGNLSVLTGVARYADWDFAQQLLGTLATAPTAEVETLLLRSDLFHFCRLLRWKSWQMASVVSRQLFDRLRPKLEELLDQADWPIRARAAYQLAHAPPLPLMAAMTSLIWDRLEAVEPPVPEGESMRVFLYCARYLLNAAPDRSSQAVALLERHLPPAESWPSRPGFLHWGRHVLRMACEPEIDNATARAWLRAACRQEVAPLISTAPTLDVFLYFWNLYALWFQLRECDSGEFREVLAGALTAEAVRVLVDRGRAIVDDNELLKQLALAGILSFADLVDENEFATRKPNRQPERTDLALLLKDITFVPAGLAVVGYEAWLGRPSGEALREDVATRLDQYPAPSVAMRFLYLWLRR